MKFLGLRTLIYPTQDLDVSRKWWESFLGVPPYFAQPFYVGFQVGGHEIGFNPDAYMAFGAVTYLGVDSIQDGLTKAESLGCTVVSPIEDVGMGILIVHLLSPTGDRFGLIFNPHSQVDSDH